MAPFKLNPTTGRLDLVGSSGGGGGSGTVTSVSLSPASIGSVTDPTVDPIVTINKADASTDGYLDNLDFTNFQAAFDAISDTANTFAGFNGSGLLASIPGFNISTTSGGMSVGLTEQPNNLGGATVHDLAVNFDPLQNSPNESWNIWNLQAWFDVNSSGFTQGTNGNAVQLANLFFGHNGTGDIGGLVFHNLTANIGNGTDPISIKGMTYVGNGINFAANTTIDGQIQGYTFGPSVDASAAGTSNFSATGFSDFSNIGIEIHGHTSANFSPNIASVANNSNITSLNINPTVTTFTGNAGANSVAISGTLGTFGANGGYNGINLNTNVTTMGATGYWNGIAVGGTITTSHGNVSGIQVNTQINAGDANYTAILINPNGTATLPSVSAISISLDNISSSAQKTGVNIQGGKSNFSSPYHTDILPASPGFVDMNSIGSEYWVKPGFPVTSTLTFGLNLGQAAVFEDDMGPDGFGGLLGYCANALVVQGGVATTKTVAKVTGAVIAFSVADLTSYSITDGGTITESSMLLIPGYISGGGTVSVGSLYAVNIPSSFGTFATDSWGLFNDSATENYLNKSLAIGTTSKKVTNSDVALEIGSLKAIRHSQLTTTQRDALTPLGGMMIFNTTTNDVEYYDGSAWQGHTSNVDGGTSTSVYGGSISIDGGAA